MIMKKILLLVILLLAGVMVVQGQVTAKGNFVVGASVGLSAAQSKVTQTGASGSEQEESPTSTLFSFAPSVGYFLLPEFALGIRMDYTINKVEQPGQNHIEDSDLLFGPFARFYLPIANDMAVLLEGGFGFGNSNDIQNFGDIQQKINTNIFAVSIGPGLTVFSNEAIGIEALFKYNFARSDFDTDIGGVKKQVLTHTNQFDFSVGIRFYFGGLSKIKSVEYY